MSGKKYSAIFWTWQQKSSFGYKMVIFVGLKGSSIVSAVSQLLFIFWFIHVQTVQTALNVCRFFGRAAIFHKWVSFLAGSSLCPWPSNSYTHWSSSTPNLLSPAILYNATELVCRLCSVNVTLVYFLPLSHFIQMPSFIYLLQSVELTDSYTN